MKSVRGDCHRTNDWKHRVTVGRGVLSPTSIGMKSMLDMVKESLYKKYLLNDMILMVVQICVGERAPRPTEIHYV